MSADRILSALRRHSSKTTFAVLAALAAAAFPADKAHAAPIVWHKDIRTALRASAEQHKPLMVMVGANWCGYCHKMLQQTFPDPALALRVNRQFVPVLLDADKQAEIVQKLRVDAMPTVLVISPERKIVGRIAGFQSAAQLAARLAPYQRAASPPKTVDGKPAFHERAWAAIQAARPRDTLEAAKAFSATR